jgi:hypothetical protein
MENGIIQLNLMKKSKFTYVILLQLLRDSLGGGEAYLPLSKISPFAPRLPTTIKRSVAVSGGGHIHRPGRLLIIGHYRNYYFLKNL